MANTTKSTRKTSAKTKAKSAPKAKASVATKKTVSKKTTAKKASAPSVAVKTDVKVSKKVGEPTPFERLRSMHIVNFFVLSLFAVLVGVWAKMTSVAVNLPIMTRDQFAGENTVVLTPAHEMLYSIRPSYVLVVALALAALSSLLLATKLRSRYEVAVSARVSGFRWVVTALSASAMLAYVYLLTGLTNVWVLKFGMGMIMVTALLGWISERENIGARAPRWFAYVISLFTGTAAWLPVLGTLVGTSLYGGERFSWVVYGVALATLLGFTGFALNQWRSMREAGRQKDYTYIEATYFQIDLFAKFAVVLMTLIAFQ
jgi:Heliorhodopsin